MNRSVSFRSGRDARLYSAHVRGGLHVITCSLLNVVLPREESQLSSSNTKIIAPALHELLKGFIDYAGLFPPAKLPLESTVRNFDSYLKGEHAWMLRNLVLPSAQVPDIAEAFSGTLSVISNEQYECSRRNQIATYESTLPFHCKQAVYCEVPTDKLEMLDELKKNGCFSKIRMGGLKPEAIPSSADAAAFINACADRQLAFKATAGLHHPVRSMQALTYEADAPRAVMHGFLNVLLAASFAWHGERDIEPVLAEMDPRAFRFDERAHWKGRVLSTEQIRAARTLFIHSVGSCSFEEPVHDLQALGLL